MVLLVTGIAVMLAGLGLVWLWLDTQSNPGGVECGPGQSCPTSWWYWESTRDSEIQIAFPLLLLGTALLTVAAVRR
jgi:hypothetical protein